VRARVDEDIDPLVYHDRSYTALRSTTPPTST